MITAYYIEDEYKYYRFFYESKTFYFAVTVNKEHPFESPVYHEFGHVYYSSDSEYNLKEWVIHFHSDRDIENGFLEAKNRPGIYYPRIWKGNMQFLNAVNLAGSQIVLSNSIVSLRIILERLFEIFTYLQPTSHNNLAYGHRTREVLLLSCMEVESSCISILRANDYSSPRFSTKDYVKLLNPMALSKYEVRFPMYPEVGIISPFLNWNSSQPTKSIEWYDAYNKTKHDREANLNVANLKNTIESVCAVAVLLCAQFGPESLPKEVQVRLNQIDYNWPYIPLASATREINPNGSTHGISYNLSSIWTEEKYKFR